MARICLISLVSCLMLGQCTKTKSSVRQSVNRQYHAWSLAVSLVLIA